jgi:hypothetical protein
VTSTKWCLHYHDNLDITACQLRTLLCLQLIVVCIERGDVRLQVSAVSGEFLDKRGNLYLETLASADTPDHVLQLASLIQRCAVHELPVVEHRLRERLSTSCLPKITVEAERLHHRQICLHCEHRCADTLLLGEYLSSPLVQHRIDTANSVLGALDLDKVHGLLQPGRCE